MESVHHNRTCILFLFLVNLKEEKRWYEVEKQISFIHAADLHIDSPFKGFTHLPDHLKEDVLASTFTAVDQLVRTAIAKDVDFVLLVGDIFDHVLHSLKAQVHVRKACEQLAEHQIDVFMSFGNHDYLKGAPFQLTYPPNVHLFRSEEVTHFPYQKNGETYAHIYGFSYENQAVTTNKAHTFQIHQNHVPFHIAMLHGSFDQNTDHEPYAPFRLTDLLKTPFDYWALGHVHQRTVLHEDPPIIYPGNIQGRHRLETGEKGCYYVRMEEGHTTTTFIPLHSIEFVQIDLDVYTCTTIEDLEREIKKQVDDYTTASTPVLIHLTCTRANPTLIQLMQHGYVRDLIDLLNEMYSHLPTWVFIYAIDLKKNEQLIEKVQMEDHFLTELHHVWETASTDKMLESLYEHPQARKFLPRLTMEEKETIKQDAFDLLMQELVHKRGNSNAIH